MKNFCKYFLLSVVLLGNTLLSADNRVSSHFSVFSGEQVELLKFPLDVRLNTLPASFNHQGWRNINGMLQSGGLKDETITAKQYSALKYVYLSAIFQFTNKQGKAGLRLINHVGTRDSGYHFLIDPSSNIFSVENRYKSKGKWVAHTIAKKSIKPHEFYQLEVISNGRLAVAKLGGEVLWQGKVPCPTFFNSGFISQKSKTAVKDLRICGGGKLSKFIALGDSITHHCRWQDTVSKEIENAGMACDGTGMALARLQSDVIAFAPEYCFILLGTNDLLDRNYTMDKSAAMLTSIVQRLKTAGIKVTLCTILPRTPAEKTDELNAKIKKIAADNDIYLHEWSADLKDPVTKTLRREYGGPDIHPNVKGVQAMGKDFLAEPWVKLIFNKN